MTRDEKCFTVLAIVVFFLTLFLASVPKSHARDNGQYAGSPLKSWFNSLADKQGHPCCSDADGNVVLDSDWESRDGHYWVRIDGEWVPVPDKALIEEPNRFGRTIVWPTYSGGVTEVRCFLKGSDS